MVRSHGMAGGHVTRERGLGASPEVGVGERRAAWQPGRRV
jgi:hypothetical protein